MNRQTIFFKNPVAITHTAAIGGPKEGEGPVGKYFDYVLSDDLLKQKSHEHAEIEMQLHVVRCLLNKAKLADIDVDCIFAGDLMDEIIGCNFAMRELDIPFMGLYNACATFGESLILGAAMIDGGFFENAVCSTTSHFATAERQYRFPLELGSQRTPLSQWTVTGAAAVLLENGKNTDCPVRITCGTVGKVVDYGVSDANDMGAVMVPAAMNTLIEHFKDTGRSPDYYDLIATGDLGHAGSRVLQKLMAEKGYELKDNYTDCGILIFNREAQNVIQGGSGACCSTLVFSSYIYNKLRNGTIKKVLLVPTGALLSKTSSLQGETIPAIAHAVSVEVVG